MKKYILPSLTILMTTTAMGCELANKPRQGLTEFSSCLGSRTKTFEDMLMLLENGADPNARFTAASGRVFNELGAAFAYGKKVHVALLLQYKANPFKIEGLPQDLLKLMLPSEELEAKNTLIDKAKRNWVE